MVTVDEWSNKEHRDCCGGSCPECGGLNPGLTNLQGPYYDMVDPEFPDKERGDSDSWDYWYGHKPTCSKYSGPPVPNFKERECQ